MKILVIIPSRRRKEMLVECLNSLRRQTMLPDEVMVVENDEKSQYKKIVKTFKDLKVRLVLEKRIGKSMARNRGIKEARGEILAFLDDDCEPGSRWLESISRSLIKGEADVVLGESLEKKQSLLTEAYVFQYNRFFLAERINFTTGEVLYGDALNSRNFSVRKEYLTKNNIWFDHRYDRFGFVEDTDFGEQLKRSGARMFYEKKAVVVHKDEEFLWPLLKKKFRNGQAMALMNKKGIYHDLQSKRKKWLAFERSRDFLKGKNVVEILYLILVLNLIVLFYRVGFYFESILDINLERVRDRLIVGLPKAIFRLLKKYSGVPLLLFYINAHTLGLVKLSKKFKRVYYRGDAYYADGWGGIRILRKLGASELEKRETAPDFFDNFCKMAVKQQTRIFFLGWREKVVAKKIKYLKWKFSKLKIVGWHNGYFKEDKKIIGKINQLKPEILIVGMGADGWGVSKQEIWSWEHRRELKVKIIWCTGALMDNYPRKKESGLNNRSEWWWRLKMHPIKFGPRYLLDALMTEVSMIRVGLIQKMRRW